MNQAMPGLYFGNIISELPTLFKIGRSANPIKRILDESKETMCLSPNYFKNNVYILYLPNTSEVNAETALFKELDKRNKRRQEEGEKENKEFFYTSREEILEILDNLKIKYIITKFSTEYDNLVYNEILEKTIHDNKKLKVNYNKRMNDIYKDRCEKLVGLDLTIGEILIRNKNKSLTEKVNFECYNQVKSKTKDKYNTSDFTWDLKKGFLILDE